MSTNMTIANLLAKTASAQSVQAPVVKTAHEQGVEDAQRVMKVASFTGDVMGNQAFEAFQGRLAASLGFDPEAEAVKTASISDLLDCAVMSSLEKIAETYSPQTGGANLTTTIQAGADQLREEGKTHALLAVQAANDALASVDQGDANTAIQSLNTASQNITLAQQVNQAVSDPELDAQVAEASNVVSNIAATIQAQG